MTTAFGVKQTLITALLAITSFFTKAQLTANFTSTPVAGCPPLLVSFTNQSTGSPTRWKFKI
jgi:PKD repeat protein